MGPLGGLLLGLACLASPLYAEDLPPLETVPRISEGTLAVGLALEIARACPEIDRRTLKGLFFLNGLRAHALSLGYSAETIDHFVHDTDQKAALRKRGQTHARKLGFDPETDAGLCALGRHEVSAGTLAGSFLRLN